MKHTCILLLAMLSPVYVAASPVKPQSVTYVTPFEAAYSTPMTAKMKLPVNRTYTTGFTQSYSTPFERAQKSLAFKKLSSKKKQ